MDQYELAFTESSLSTRDQSYVNEYVFFQEPNVYLKYMTQNRWEKMKSTFLKYFDLDIEGMKNMRPTFILSMLYQKMMVGKGASLDQRIWDYASSNGIKVAGLESVHEQIQILQKLSLRHQYQQLIKISKKISGIQAGFHKILKAYQEEDLSTLFQLSKKTLGPDKQLLLENRNVIMVDRMINQHQLQPAFFSFGAGHLVGTHGVLAMLKRKGFRIKPI